MIIISLLRTKFYLNAFALLRSKILFIAFVPFLLYLASPKVIHQMGSGNIAFFEELNEQVKITPYDSESGKNEILGPIYVVVEYTFIIFSFLLVHIFQNINQSKLMSYFLLDIPPPLSGPSLLFK